MLRLLGVLRCRCSFIPRVLRYSIIVTREEVVFLYLVRLCREMTLVGEVCFVFLWPSGTNTMRDAMGNINN